MPATLRRLSLLPLLALPRLLAPAAAQEAGVPAATDAEFVEQIAVEIVNVEVFTPTATASRCTA
jgi:hypothetical protein